MNCRECKTQLDYDRVNIYHYVCKLCGHLDGFDLEYYSDWRERYTFECHNCSNKNPSFFELTQEVKSKLDQFRLYGAL